MTDQKSAPGPTAVTQSRREAGQQIVAPTGADRMSDGEISVDRPGKTVTGSRVEISRLMRPQDGNFAGNVHGGILLGLMDEIAYLCASRYAETYCVTAAVHQVDFHAPVRVGDLVTLRASVNLVGRSSMEVGISIVAEDPRNPSSGRRTNRCFLTMVALDGTGRPTPVPELVHETDEDDKWRCEAELRRHLRRRYHEEIEKGACAFETEPNG